LQCAAFAGSSCFDTGHIFYTNRLLHQAAFTTDTFYSPFTPNNFYTTPRLLQALFTADTVYKFVIPVGISHLTFAYRKLFVLEKNR